jgi:iron(III) transport system substrate-binding protein
MMVEGLRAGPRISRFALLLLALGLAACGKPKPVGPRVITLYTSRHDAADKQVVDAFTRTTGIKVRRLELEPDRLVDRLKAEGPGSPADVILMGDAGGLWRAEAAGLFRKLSAPELDDRIPPELRDPQGRWWAFSRRARVIAYDRTRVKPEEAATYEQLAAPRFRSGLCLGASDSPSAQSLMAAFIEHWGRAKALDWARGVVANFARPPRGGDIDQIRAVGAGACLATLTDTDAYLRLAASKNARDQAIVARVALSFPDRLQYGTQVNVSGGGIAAHARHVQDAEAFLDFLASDAAQNIFARSSHEYPVVTSVTPPPDVQAIADFRPDPMPLSTLGRRQAEARAVYDEAGWR